MTRRQLLASMDADELAHWRAKQQIDGPFLAERIDWAVARLLANYMSTKTAEGQRIADYLPPYLRADEPVELQTEEEMKAEVEKIQQLWGR